MASLTDHEDEQINKANASGRSPVVFVHPEVFAHKSVGQIADHFEDVISKLTARPAIAGHSFGGLLTQILAGRGLAAASVAIDPAPFRGVLPRPISALTAPAPVIHNPANRSATWASPRSSRCPTAGTRSRSSAGGERSPTLCSPSSSASSAPMQLERNSHEQQLDHP